MKVQWRDGREDLRGKGVWKKRGVKETRHTVHVLQTAHTTIDFCPNPVFARIAHPLSSTFIPLSSLLVQP